MLNKKLLLATVIFSVFIVSCQPGSVNINNTNQTNASFGTNTSVNNSENYTPDNGYSEDNLSPIRVDRGVKINESNYSVVVTGVEGELIKLEPEAIDPDGDVVSFNYTKPFNEEGEWKTELGDAGRYLVTVSAFDGEATTRQKVLVEIERKNRKPHVSCPDKITVTETEYVTINCNIQDPEGDEVVTIYRGFMTTKRYQTTFDDEGTHEVYVTSWDKKNVNEKVEETVKVVVKDLNREPKVSFDFGRVINAKEGDVVSVQPNVTDPDGDNVSIQYSEPFNDDGVWNTEIGDAGKYNSSVVVTDGENVVKKVFQVDLAVKNTAPRLEVQDEIRVEEGDRITLDIQTFDREDDDVDVEISGFMTSESYTATYDDAYPGGCNVKGCTAHYTVTVRASDGRLENTKTVDIYIEDKNRPPIFRSPA